MIAYVVPEFSEVRSWEPFVENVPPPKTGRRKYCVKSSIT